MKGRAVWISERTAFIMRKKRIDFKRLTDLALSLLVLAGAVSLAWIGLTGSKDIAAMTDPHGFGAEKTASPDISIPASAIAIVIDAGHGGFDGGAVGTVTGAVEAELNLKVSELLAEELTKLGFYVVMTRTDGEAIGKTKAEDMSRRKEIMQLENVDLVVSIHMNKFRDRTVSGPMVFYMKGSTEGKALADCVIISLCESVGRPPRAANPEDLFVLRVPTVPSILVECGFLSNADDEAKLITGDYQRLLARGVAEGIANYLAQKENGDSE